MKVLFINGVFAKGSTGRIIKDLGDYLLNRGDNYVAAYGRGSRIKSEHTYFVGNKFSVGVHALASRLSDRAGFYSKLATKKLIDFIREYNPDIIHIHNLHGYYLNVESLFNFLKNEYHGKILWTLHDCWPFTGHCVHFTYAKCNRWEKGCNKCPLRKEYPSSFLFDRSRKNYLEKKALFSGCKNLEIITVSNWLKTIVEKSFLNQYKVSCIYNGVDTSIYRYQDNHIKEELKIKNKKIILLISDGWIEQKGFSRAKELACSAPDNWVFIMIGLNKSQIHNLPKNIIGIERIWNKSRLIDFYSAADVFYNPSIEETFGMVTAESLACGTPVVVLNSTACPELVTNANCGVVLDPESSVFDTIKAIEKCFPLKNKCNMPFTKERFLREYGEMYK